MRVTQAGSVAQPIPLVLKEYIVRVVLSVRQHSAEDGQREGQQFPGFGKVALVFVNEAEVADREGDIAVVVSAVGLAEEGHCLGVVAAAELELSQPLAGIAHEGQHLADLGRLLPQAVLFQYQASLVAAFGLVEVPGVEVDVPQSYYCLADLEARCPEDLLFYLEGV